MDKNSRLDHLLDLLGTEKDLLAHLQAHRTKLDGHHQSRERDRAIKQAVTAARRAERVVRKLERAVQSARKQHGVSHTPRT